MLILSLVGAYTYCNSLSHLRSTYAVKNEVENLTLGHLHIIKYIVNIWYYSKSTVFDYLKEAMSLKLNFAKTSHSIYVYHRERI